ncbi:MAG: hypothetical protein QNK23_03380 [Crocinitomicaceae bacterium]|nr:hypothetical protein [Crocinitomicaceae bacterium]
MNKALYIIGIVFSVLFISVAAYYMNVVWDARWDYIYGDYDWMGGYDEYTSPDRYRSLSLVACLWSMLFFLSFLAIDIMGLIKIKTMTTKVLSIIGISITGICFMFNLVVMSSEGGISYDEIAPAWFIYCLIMLAFSIVGLVQSVKFANGSTNQQKGIVNKEGSDLLDS